MHNLVFQHCRVLKKIYIKYCNYGKPFNTTNTQKTLKNEAKVSKCFLPHSFLFLISSIFCIFPSDLNHLALFFISVISRANLETFLKVVKGRTWTVLEYCHPCPDGEMWTASCSREPVGRFYLSHLLVTLCVCQTSNVGQAQWGIWNIAGHRCALKAVGIKLRSPVLFGPQFPVPLLQICL